MAGALLDDRVPRGYNPRMPASVPEHSRPSKAPRAPTGTWRVMRWGQLQFADGALSPPQWCWTDVSPFVKRGFACKEHMRAQRRPMGLLSIRQPKTRNP